MSVQSHLSDRSAQAILSDTERASIGTSVTTLQKRLDAYFKTALSDHFRFGSSTRNTILPRRMDANSDVDYMLVFSDSDSRPQTYISRLKRFAENCYNSSEIAQSSPTVVLTLNHIKFDLVPAINSYSAEYQIPGPASGFQDWISTSPNGFNQELSTANTQNGSRLKPTIRLLKYWNAMAGYIFDSYTLEQWVARRYYYSCNTIRDHFFNCIENLQLEWGSAQWRQLKLERAQTIVANTKSYESRGESYSAETEIKRLIP